MCPLCKMPILPGQTIIELTDEPQCHYVCRVMLLSAQEKMEDDDATREYNRREEEKEWLEDENGDDE